MNFAVKVALDEVLKSLHEGWKNVLYYRFGLHGVKEPFDDS